MKIKQMSFIFSGMGALVLIVASALGAVSGERAVVAPPEPTMEVIRTTTPTPTPTTAIEIITWEPQDAVMAAMISASLEKYCDIIVAPDEITETHLLLIETLHINKSLSSLDDLASLPNLESLTIEKQTSQYSLSPILDGLKLAELTITESDALFAAPALYEQMTGGLNTLTQLTSLTISTVGLTNEMLAGFTVPPALTELNIAGNAITDITPLAQFYGLKTLNISGMQIIDISPLANLTSLQNVVALYVQITDWTPVAHIENVVGRPNTTHAPATATPRPTTRPTPTATPIPVSTPTTIAVTGVELSQRGVILDVGGKKQLIATVSPSDATNKTVSWSSSNPSVAAVDSSGNVTAIAEGSATITASCGGKTASCTVSVS